MDGGLATRRAITRWDELLHCRQTRSTPLKKYTLDWMQTWYTDGSSGPFTYELANFFEEQLCRTARKSQAAKAYIVVRRFLTFVGDTAPEPRDRIVTVSRYHAPKILNAYSGESGRSISSFCLPTGWLFEIRRDMLEVNSLMDWIYYCCSACIWSVRSELSCMEFNLLDVTLSLTGVCSSNWFAGMYCPNTKPTLCPTW